MTSFLTIKIYTTSTEESFGSGLRLPGSDPKEKSDLNPTHNTLDDRIKILNKIRIQTGFYPMKLRRSIFYLSSPTIMIKIV